MVTSLVKKSTLCIFLAAGCVPSPDVMSDGRMVELSTIGNQGMVGVTAFLGGDIAVGDAIVQVEDGPAQAMTTEAFHRELDRRGPFYDQMSRYAQAYHALIMQSAACFSMHSVEERCCRWLLMTHDRAHRDEFQLTHELLSYMLGARRPTVSLVLGTLERTGAIQNGTKRITIVDRNRLEEMSCECYAAVVAVFERLLPGWSNAPTDASSPHLNATPA